LQQTDDRLGLLHRDHVLYELIDGDLGLVVVICIASGLLLIAAGIPLWLRRVPRNALYGARFASTLSDDRIWYEINARCGRDLVVIGAGYLALLAAALLFGRSWSMPFRLLGPTVVLVVALIVNTILVSRAATRLLAERDLTNRSKLD
jgi:uncharacterized membrane protein